MTHQCRHASACSAASRLAANCGASISGESRSRSRMVARNRRQTRKVGRKLRGPLHVGLGSLRDEFRISGMGQEAHADARGVPLPGEGYHGNSHPQGFAGRGHAMIGKRVQSYVDPIVLLQMLKLGGFVIDELQARQVDSAIGEVLLETPSGLRRRERRRF